MAMSEDLIIGTSESVPEDEHDEDLEIEFEAEEIDLHAEINSAYFALDAVNSMDDKLYSKDRARMIRAIRRKCLDILHANITARHDNVFGRSETADEEEDD
jgi:hypothetical protein